MDICNSQQLFMVFYAVFWAFLANVQPRWKAFHWTLAFEKVGGTRRPGRRLILSFVCLNILPIVYFGLVFWVLRDARNVSLLVIRGVLPALGVFGFYRIWLGFVESTPWTFYLDIRSRDTGMPWEWRFAEPTYVTPTDGEAIAKGTFVPPNDHKDMPVVYIGDPDSGKRNISWGVAYVVVFGVIAFLSSWL